MICWVLAAGVAAGVLGGSTWIPAYGLGAVTAALAASFRPARKRLLIAIALLGTLVGAARAHVTTASVSVLSTLASEVQVCTVKGRVDARTGSIGTFLRVGAVACEGAFTPVASMVVGDESDLEPGAPVTAVVRLLPLGSGSFDRMRARMGAEARFTFEGEASAEQAEGVQGIAGAVRSGVTEASSSLDGSKRTLLTGLTIGDVEDFTFADEERFRRSGLTHLVAVSGSNVAIVVGALVLVFGRLPKVAVYAIAAAGLVLYVTVVGPDPSVLRAGAMGLIGIVAVLSGRRAEPLAALGLACALVVLARPYLLFSVGLHLSAAATAGIVLWGASIAAAVPGPRWITLPLGVTLSAQIAVAPILLGVFGSVSISSLPANLLAAPAVAPATILGLSAGVVAMVFPWLGGALAWSAFPAVAWIDGLATFFGLPDWAEIEAPATIAWAVAVVVAISASVTARRRFVPAHRYAWP